MYESAEWAVRNELETLMTAAVAVEDVCAVTAQCMATYEQAWLGDQELSMVCSKPPSMSAALACKMPWSGARGNIDVDNDELDDERDGGRVKNGKVRKDHADAHLTLASLPSCRSMRCSPSRN